MSAAAHLLAGAFHDRVADNVVVHGDLRFVAFAGRVQQQNPQVLAAQVDGYVLAGF